MSYWTRPSKSYVDTMKITNEDVFKRYDKCKNRDQAFCKKFSHDVGVNGYSILYHCKRCMILELVKKEV